MAKISLLDPLEAPTGDETVVIVVDGVTKRAKLGPVVQAAVDSFAVKLGFEEALGGWQDVVVDLDGRVLSGYHPLLGDFDARLDGIEIRLDVLEAGGTGPVEESIARVGGWITATVDRDGRVVEGNHELLGLFPGGDAASDGVSRAIKVAELRSLRLASLPAPHATPPIVSRTLGNASFIADPMIIANGDARLTYGYAPVAAAGPDFPLNEFYDAKWITSLNDKYAAYWGLRFVTDSPQIELPVYRGGQISIVVDGHPIGEGTAIVVPNDGNQYGVVIDFGADVKTIQPALTLQSAGAGYRLGDRLAVPGTAGEPISIIITAIDGNGAIQRDGWRIASWGALTALAAAAVAVTGGSGNGATIRLTDDRDGLTHSGRTTRRMRRIEIVVGGGGIARPLRLTKGSTVRPLPFAGPRLMIMQDSYGQVFSDRPDSTWIRQCATMLGIEDVWQNTFGGTGFTAGAVKYGTRLTDITSHLPSADRTLVFITQGSVNDAGATEADLRAAVEAYWRAAFVALPNDAIMIQTGILRGGGNNPSDALSAALRDGFRAACAAHDPQSTRSGFIETREALSMMSVPDVAANWLAGDNVHPTQPGHDLIAAAMASVLQRIFQSLSI